MALQLVTGLSCHASDSVHQQRPQAVTLQGLNDPGKFTLCHSQPLDLCLSWTQGCMSSCRPCTGTFECALWVRACSRETEGAVKSLCDDESREQLLSGMVITCQCAA